VEFEILSRVHEDTFHPLEIKGRSGYFLLPLKPLKAGSKLFVKDFEQTAHLKTNFDIGGAWLDKENACFDDLTGVLFYSRLQVYNYSTSIMSYSMSWQKSVSKVAIREEQTSLVFKSPLFYVYEVPTIATLVTCGDLNSRLHSYLTMI
jgi:hypothetical protein